MNFLRRHFGKITPERRGSAMVKEAADLAQKFAVLAMENHAIEARARIDCRHHAELSDHYATMARTMLAKTQEELK